MLPWSNSQRVTLGDGCHIIVHWQYRWLVCGRNNTYFVLCRWACPIPDSIPVCSTNTSYFPWGFGWFLKSRRLPERNTEVAPRVASKGACSPSTNSVFAAAPSLVRRRHALKLALSLLTRPRSNQAPDVLPNQPKTNIESVTRLDGYGKGRATFMSTSWSAHLSPRFPEHQSLLPAPSQALAETDAKQQDPLPSPAYIISRCTDHIKKKGKGPLGTTPRYIDWRLGSLSSYASAWLKVHQVLKVDLFGGASWNMSSRRRSVVAPQ